MKYEKPDGTIEIQGSGCCCAPGQIREGQHTNGGTEWLRVKEGEWQNTQSLPLSRTALRTIAGAADTVEEFEAVLLAADMSWRMAQGEQ